MNNGNNVDNNFPTVDGMVVNDTPAESFDNLYGNNMAQTVNNVNPGMINTQSTTPNINNGANNINQQPINNTVGTPNVAGQSINNGMNTISGQPTNNAGVNPNMNNVNPGMINNQQMNMNSSPINNPAITPNFATPNMNSVVNNVSEGPTNNTVVTPNVSAQNINNAISQQGMNNTNTANQQIMPNQGVINSGQPMNMNVNLETIDSDKMQSIEEQLSKTSQYNPEDLQQEKITIPSDNQYEKNKSGLSFVIVLFIILALVIIFLPQITKLIK